MDALSRAIALIDEALAKGQPVILALEGGAASGKTTLAEQLSLHYKAPVIHMDDFFLSPEMRTAERFAQPGGNIHFERFEAQVADPIRRGEGFSYEIFDCCEGRIVGKRKIEKCPLLLVEGVYSLHPCYQDIYTHRIFLRTSQEIQNVRLKARGEWLYQRFQTVWLPLERDYFQHYQIENYCDLTLDT